MGGCRIPARRKGLSKPPVYFALDQGKVVGFGNYGSRGRDPSQLSTPQAPPNSINGVPEATGVLSSLLRGKVVGFGNGGLRGSAVAQPIVGKSVPSQRLGRTGSHPSRRPPNSSVGRFVDALDGCIQNSVILLIGLLE